MFRINYCDYNRSNPDYDIINRPDGSGDYLFLYFLTPMKIQLDGELVIAKEGAFILFTPGHAQCYQAVRKFQNSFIHFQNEEAAFLQEYDIPVNQVFYPPNPGALNELFREIYVETVTKQEYYTQQIDKLMHTLFILLSRQLHAYAAESGINASLYEQFQKARIKMLTHPEQDWNVEQMAALTHLGTSQFYHYYKLYFNRSPKSELLDARIERAKYLLQIEKLPINQAATQAGFESLSHFTRYFKKQCGMAPSEYAMQIDVGKND